MENNFENIINKYIKVSLIIGIIDLISFYIIGKLIDNMGILNCFIDNWKYIAMYISGLTVLIYLFDIIFFHNRNMKYKFLFIFKQPFHNWYKYVNADIEINSKDINKKFYQDIYKKVSDISKIKGIMEDEIMLRDVYIHLITTNMLILTFVFLLENISLLIYLYVISIIIVFAILFNCGYRQMLKYYISEIYKEYKKIR